MLGLHINCLLLQNILVCYLYSFGHVRMHTHTHTHTDTCVQYTLIYYLQELVFMFIYLLFSGERHGSKGAGD